MKKNYVLFFCFIFLNFTQAQGTIAGWNFNLSTTNTTTGTGTLSFVGGTGSAVYINNGGTQALGFADFPAATVGSGTAGIRFAASTVGYTGISISFDTYGHNQSSRWQQFEYTTNGSTWNVLSNNNGGLSSTFTTTTLNFPASCDNNPNFAFRIVSIFNPSGGTQYEQVQGGGYNGNNGKWYFDNVNITFATLKRNENSISNLKVYPNPATTVVNIISEGNAPQTVEIFNVLGKKVATTKVNHDQINVSSLPKGVYMLKFSEEGKTATRKIVIE